MNSVVDALLTSPMLPEAVAKLKAVVNAERQRRVRFYAELTPDVRVEFINGEVIVHPPTTLGHSQVRQHIESLLSAFVVDGDLGKVCGVESLCVFPRNDYEPDVIFFGPQKAAKLRAKTLKFPVPDFACEVLSDSTAKRDRGVKFQDYEAHGVREYWLVAPERRELEQYVLEKGRYVLRMKSRTGEVTSVAIKGFVAPLVAFFDAKANLAALRSILG